MASWLLFASPFAVCVSAKVNHNSIQNLAASCFLLLLCATINHDYHCELATNEAVGCVFASFVRSSSSRCARAQIIALDDKVVCANETLLLSLCVYLQPKRRQFE